MKRIEVYQTFDGQKFYSELEAKRHESTVTDKLVILLQTAMTSVQGQRFKVDALRAADILIDNRDGILALLGGKS